MGAENTYLCDEYKLYFKVEEDVQVLHNEVEMYNTSFVGNNCFCHEEFVDGVKTLKYSIPAMLTLNQFMKKKIHKDELLEIMFSIADQLMYLNANNMPLGKVILNIGYMYLNVEDMSVQLIYLPLGKPMEKCNMKEFVREFISQVKYANKRASDLGMELLTYFDENELFYLSEFYKFILDKKNEEAELAKEDLVYASQAAAAAQAVAADDGQTNVTPVEAGDAAAPAPAPAKPKSGGIKLAKEKRDYSLSDVGFEEADMSAATTVLKGTSTKSGPSIVRTRTNETIRIDKPIFCIGKSSQGVDYQVTDNSSVSRRHAYIINVNGVYYLRDNKSTNHTYLGGRALSPGNDMMLIDGSRFKLANEEFTFHDK